MASCTEHFVADCCLSAAGSFMCHSNQHLLQKGHGELVLMFSIHLKFSHGETSFFNTLFCSSSYQIFLWSVQYTQVVHYILNLSLLFKFFILLIIFFPTKSPMVTNRPGTYMRLNSDSCCLTFRHCQHSICLRVTYILLLHCVQCK